MKVLRKRKEVKKEKVGFSNIEIEKKGDDLEKSLKELNAIYLEKMNNYSNLFDEIRIA